MQPTVVSKERGRDVAVSFQKKHRLVFYYSCLFGLGYAVYVCVCVCVCAFAHTYVVVCVCVCVRTWLPWYTCEGQRMTFGDHFSPFSVQVLGLKLRFSGLVAGAFTC